MKMKKQQLRTEQPDDYKEIYRLHEAAFGGDEESRLVERLRKSEGFVPELSVVAEGDEGITGHILFTEISIQPDAEGASSQLSLSLAPMAVLPAFQKQGIGKALVGEGLRRATVLNYSSVIVLGHPDYYPAFGFVKASEFGLRSVFEAPDEAFMAMELKEEALSKCMGEVVYSPEFFKE